MADDNIKNDFAKRFNMNDSTFDDFVDHITTEVKEQMVWIIVCQWKIDNFSKDFISKIFNKYTPK